MRKREAWKRPMCSHCRKRTAYRNSAICATCAATGIPHPPEPPRCRACGCARGLNFENCRACDLTVRIAILRVRLARQWRTFTGAIKELYRGS